MDTHYVQSHIASCEARTCGTQPCFKGSLIPRPPHHPVFDCLQYAKSWWLKGLQSTMRWTGVQHSQWTGCMDGSLLYVNTHEVDKSLMMPLKSPTCSYNFLGFLNTCTFYWDLGDLCLSRWTIYGWSCLAMSNVNNKRVYTRPASICPIYTWL